MSRVCIAKIRRSGNLGLVQGRHPADVGYWVSLEIAPNAAQSTIWVVRCVRNSATLTESSVNGRKKFMGASFGGDTGFGRGYCDP
jgi:hypothetical protein